MEIIKDSKDVGLIREVVDAFLRKECTDEIWDYPERGIGFNENDLDRIKKKF
jgi:hypothetical protein